MVESMKLMNATKDDTLERKEHIRMKSQDAQDKAALTPPTITPSSKPIRAHEETLAKMDPRLRKIYEHYRKWSRVAKKFGYTERGIASWVRNGIPECREGMVDKVVAEIEGKKGKA